jgi:hypothetical protein
MINLVQKLEFETDSLADMEKMIELIVYTEFRHQNSEYTQLHMKKNPPSHWEDGSEYKFSDKAIIDVGGKIYVIEPTYMQAGAKQFKPVKEYKSLDAAAKDAYGSEKLPPTNLWVATLSDSHCGFKKGEDHACNTKAQMINRAAHSMQIAARDKKEAFEELRVPDWMANGDGSYSMGFRIASSWDSGSRVLYLSLCHIYYGK